MLVLAVASAALAAEGRIAAQRSLPRPDGCTTQRLGAAAIDVPSIVVQPRFLLNGKPFPGAEAGAALLTLWASEASELYQGPQLVLGETQLAHNSVRVVPGVYDVYYSWITGSGVPRNQLTRVLQSVTLDRDRELVVDVAMISVEGVKQHNGNPFGYDGAAALSLRAIDWPGEVPLGAAQPAEFQVAVIPGSYAFEYDWQQGVDFPNNRRAVVRQLDLRTPVAGLVLNVPSVIQPFAFLHNGAAFPSTEFDRGDLVLRRGAREEVVAGSSHEGGAAIRVIPGSYDVHWRHMVGANVPNNQDTRVARGLVANGVLRVIDVPSLEVSGTFLVNGQPTPQSEFENARISLVGPEKGDTLVLGQTRFGGYVKRVLPGVYQIVYESLTGETTLPANPRATLAPAWRVENSPERTIDIPAGTYKGDFLWNGGPFSSSEFNSGEIYAVPAAADWHPVSLGRTHFGGFDRLLLPGRYGAAYAHVVGSMLPQNTFATFGPQRRVLEDDDVTWAIDVPSGPLEVSYFHNGTPLPEGGAQNARVHLARGLNYLRLHDSIEGPRTLEAVGGKFDLFYEFRGGPDLPRNAFMRFGCWHIVR
jgi:hypothetical protein